MPEPVARKALEAACAIWWKHLGFIRAGKQQVAKWWAVKCEMDPIAAEENGHQQNEEQSGEQENQLTGA